MFLYEVFPPELIKIGLEAEDKEEVFEEMVSHFCKVERTQARAEILGSLNERECQLSTGIKKGIAVPHGKVCALSRSRGVLGISGKGIDYEALDGQPVYLLFMVLSPLEASEDHLRCLTRLDALLENPVFFTDIMDQRDALGVCGVIEKHEIDFIGLG